MTALAQSVAEAIPGMPVRDDEADRLSYARDLWPRHHLAVRAGHPLTSKPGAIAWPRTTEEVAAVASYCAERGIAMVPFGAGSGVCGGILPGQDSLVVDVKRMEAFRRIDRDARVVDVETGHMGVPFEERLARAGLTLGHFPSSILCSTVGGWIAGRGAGQCSGYYGKIEDMVVGLELVTAKGGETIAALNGKSYTMAGGETLICDENGPVWLDELNPGRGNHADEPSFECSLLCAIAEMDVTA
jgi:alkyldihydroxyacetonephosphate synthase